MGHRIGRKRAGTGGPRGGTRGARPHEELLVPGAAAREAAGRGEARTLRGAARRPNHIGPAIVGCVGKLGAHAGDEIARCVQGGRMTDGGDDTAAPDFFRNAMPRRIRSNLGVSK